jgi:hypothetical protein
MDKACSGSQQNQNLSVVRQPSAEENDQSFIWL